MPCNTGRRTNNPSMASPSSKTQPGDCPEFAVRRETISSYFHPPLASSTFHDLVNKGKIIPVKGIRGFYKLNDSLRRLGLREVPSLPSEPVKHSMEDILRLAFTLIDPTIFPVPPWLLTEENLEMRDADHARLHAGVHRENIEALGTTEEKLAYFNGILGAQALLEDDLRTGGG